MTKLDLKKELASYRARQGVFEIVDVPRLRYLAVDGSGDPNTSAAYADAVSAVFGFAYALKFLSKNELDRDYVVMPLEAQWWSDDMRTFTSDRDKSRWMWTALNVVPGWISDDHLAVARERAAKKNASEALEQLRVEDLAEGRCVQTLHIGSYDDEAHVLAELHDVVIPAQGLVMRGLHHEIYLNDVRRTAPEKLRTILRQPVEPA